MRDNERVLEELGLARGEELVDGPGVGISQDTVVEFAEQPHGFLRSGPADAVVAFEEEVVPRVGRRHDRVIEDGERAHAGKHQVLEEAGAGCGGRQDEDVGRLEGRLAGGCPEAQLAVVPAGLAVWRAGEGRRAVAAAGGDSQVLGHGKAGARR